MNLVRQALLCFLLLVLAASTAHADWSYDYVDDFSTDKVQSDCYSSSLFWSSDLNPPFRPDLYCLGTGSSRGLVFVDYRGDLARLEYCFPGDGSQAHRLIKGTLQLDVSFPCNGDISQSPAGQLQYSLSSDGLAWTTAQSLPAGHYNIPLSSPDGACYVLLTGTRVVIDNLHISLTAPAATLRVPQNYPTLQQALDAAASGSVIEVAAGTYTGSGNWDLDFRGKRLTLRSADGPQTTIIDCGKPATGYHRGFYFHQAETADALLSGFTIRGGRVNGTMIPADPLHWNASAANAIGGGIYCEFSSPTICNCIITDCGAELWGGLGCVGGQPTLIACTIKSCIAGGVGVTTAGGRGAGLALVGGCNARISNCTIQANAGYINGQGGGIYCYQSSAVIAGCTILANLAQSNLRGGGVYCAGDGTDVTLKNCVIAQNTAAAGAGVSIQRVAPAVPSLAAPGARCRVSLVNCTVAQNSSPAGTAAGVESSGADTRIANSIVYGNTNGTALVITSAAVTTPVSYSDIQGGSAGTGNLNTDPRFASTSLPDYHLQSTAGRYDPQSGRWVTDAASSPCIDTGDPTASTGDEPAPNGDRIDLGAYGGTRQASKGAAHVFYYVDGRNGWDWNDGLSRTRAFATLQKAINIARNGDTVFVAPGTYQEEVTFDHKAITVQSLGDAPVVTAPTGYAFSFYGAESTRSVLTNLVITGCGEGGIFCSGASPTLRNLTVVGNEFGIMAYSGADPNITNCIIASNTAGQLFQCKSSYSCIYPSDPKNPNKGIGNISADPLFADPQHGDYHLRSQWGRYVPLTGTWTLDSASSPCLDAGDPTDSTRAERMPNGSRVNMGSDGGTIYAGLSSGPVCK
jgi:parallel beta-helix repeat protein